jgi:hypothetical protein
LRCHFTFNLSTTQPKKEKKMKKLLSTIGLGVALMAGFAPSQAEAAVVNVTTTGPNTWNYDVTAVPGELNTGGIITLITKGTLTGVSSFSNNGIFWAGTGAGTSTATWTASGSGLSKSTSFSGFAITSFDPNGPVKWASSTGGAGTTSGPVPEPATVLLLGIGGLLAGGRKLYESRKDVVTA